jgi:hypothetical protein
MIFTLYGALLIIYGVVADPAIFVSSLGVNIDIWWGIAMLAFGLVMGILTFRAWRREGS